MLDTELGRALCCCRALPETKHYLPPKRKTTPAWIRALF